ncbi:hypothetical protein Tco_0017353 [Tanacetum coccineum]
MATQNRIYVAPSHTEKIFTNMRRQGKDFSGRVTPLFPTMVVQAQEEMVVSSEEASLGDQEDASKQGRKIDDIDADEDITLENVHDADMFGVNDLDGDEVVVESEVTDKAGEKRNVVEEVVAVTDAVTIPVSAATITNVKGQGSKDKGKAKMIEPEKPLKKKDQIKFDEEEALRLQAKFNEEDRLAREKAQQVEEANMKRKKHFAAKRVEEKRNRPPTRAQQRSAMCTYLKNMAGWKPKDLKNKNRDVKGTENGRKFKKAEVMEESSSKGPGDELQQESTKKQKIDDDQERVELQSLMNVVPDEEEVAVDAIPLATKPPSIVYWKIVKEGKISYYQIIRADGSSRRYSAFIQMLRNFDREDLETLWKLVIAKHGYTKPEEAVIECYGVI